MSSYTDAEITEMRRVNNVAKTKGMPSLTDAELDAIIAAGPDAP